MKVYPLLVSTLAAALIYLFIVSWDVRYLHTPSQAIRQQQQLVKVR